MPIMIHTKIIKIKFEFSR